ncbi:MAG: alpha/beta hydrolase [Bacteroidota bacterium]
MKTIERNHLKLAYSEVGKGDFTLLFVHGSFINQDYWHEQVSFFKSTYKIVTLDLAGHGQSGNNRDAWTIQEFGEDVAAVIQALNLKNVILIGHSMGGDVILEVALKYPQAIIGFIGVDYFKNAGTPPSNDVQKQLDQILNNLQNDFSNTSEAYVRQGLLTPATDKTLADRVVTAYRNANPNMGFQAIASLFSYALRERELMQQLKWKMYLIQVDYMPTNEEPLKKYAGAGYEILPLQGTCHFPMLEKPVAFNRLLQNAIEKISAVQQRRQPQ